MLGLWNGWEQHPTTPPHLLPPSGELSADTTLGSGNSTLYQVMRYRRGEGCVGGVSRQVNVTVACGPETALSEVEEDGMCLYRMRLTTPAACVPSSRLKQKRTQANAAVDGTAAPPSSKKASGGGQEPAAGHSEL